MAANTDEPSPAAAYQTLNDPVAEKDRIRAAARQGFSSAFAPPRT